MKITTFSAMLFAVSASLAASPAMAQGTAGSTVSVSAKVTANCTASTTAVAFGDINTLNSANTDATGSLSVTCTSGTAWSASAAAGSGADATVAARKLTSGSNSLSYALYTNAERSTLWGDGTASTAPITGRGTGQAQPNVIYARVPGGQTSAPAGSYSDTVAITVTY